MNHPRPLNLGFVISMLLCALFWALLISHASAEPVSLTRDQVRTIERVNQEVNGRFAHFAPNGHGLCWWLAQNKRALLVARGIPAAALSDRIVLAWHRELHQLLTVDAVVDGRPWRESLDMNSPWLENDAQVRQMGYEDVDQAVARP